MRIENKKTEKLFTKKILRVKETMIIIFLLSDVGGILNVRS